MLTKNEFTESSITEECDTDELANNPEKLLIFTTGSKTYTPHKVGFKRIKLVTFPRRLDPGPSLRERIAQQKRERERQNTPSMEDWLNYESVADKFDKIDHLIDLHGHIIGMGLSPDHRSVIDVSRINDTRSTCIRCSLCVYLQISLCKYKAVAKGLCYNQSFTTTADSSRNRYPCNRFGNAKASWHDVKSTQSIYA